MDTDFAIERNRGLLIGIVSALIAMIGLTEDGMIERVSRPVYRKVQRVLRSAESAVRRLVIASAHGVVVESTPERPAPVERKSSAESKAEPQDKRDGTVKRKRRLLFSLFDRPRRKD